MAFKLETGGIYWGTVVYVGCQTSLNTKPEHDCSYRCLFRERWLV